MDKKDTALNESHSPLPAGAAQFQFVSYMITRLDFLKIRKFLSSGFFYISPEIPFSIIEFFKPKRGKLCSVFWSAFILTLLFAFVGQVITTTLEGSFIDENIKKIYFSYDWKRILCDWKTILDAIFIGKDPDKVYFLNDWKNILNYLFICPLYVGLSIIFFLTLMNIRIGALELATSLGDRNSDFSNGKMPAFIIIFIVFAISAIFIVNYIAEVLDPGLYRKEMWFVLKTTPSKDRILGAAGIYYALVNYVLNLITVFAAFSFAYLVYYASKVGEIIENKELKDEINFTKLKNHLTQFVYSYIIAKGLVATYMINVLYTWPISNPNESANYLIGSIAILIIGLVIVPFPRYYIQKRWFEFSIKRAKAGLGAYPDYQDLRSYEIHGLSLLLDGFIILNAGKEILSALKPLSVLKPEIPFPL